MNRKKGFSLPELVMVIVVIGILSAAGVAGVGAWQDVAHEREAIAKVQQVDAGIEYYASTVPGSSSSYSAASNANQRWSLIGSYVTKSGGSLADFQPDGGYTITLPSALSAQAVLRDSSNNVVSVY